MSFIDYVHDMTQKYRLAIAVAILKGKPNELSVEQYIEKLKTKYKATEMEIDDDDLNTICSDDFRLDDDDIDVIKDAFEISFDDEKGPDTEDAVEVTISNGIAETTDENLTCVTRNNSFMDVFQTLRDIDENVSTEKDTFVNMPSTQSTFYEDSQLYEDPTVKVKTLAATVNLNINNKTTEVFINDLPSTSKANRSINTVASHSNNQINDENKRCDNDNNIYDSQATELYSLPLATQNYTHVSQSQLEEIHIPRNYIHPKGHDKRNIENEIESIERDEENMENDVTNVENSKNSEHVKDTNKDIAVVINGGIKNVKDNENIVKEDDMSSTYVQNTDNNDTMIVIPPNDEENVQIPKENAHNENPVELVQNLNETLSVNKVDSSQIQYIIDRDGRMFRILHISHQNDPNNIAFDPIDTPHKLRSNKIENNLQTFKPTSITEEFNAKSQEINNDVSIVIGEKEKHITIKPTNVTTVQKINTLVTIATCNDVKFPKQLNVVEDNTSQNENNEETSSDFDDETAESQTEVVSFKVIEELNRIKTFLSRNVERKNTDGSLTDSGYKSDSQKSQILRNAQTPSSLNQAAFCLYRHLLECHLTATTHELTREISQVLASLVDKLHDDENYPPFLAELLGTIDKAIVELCHGDSYGKDVLLKKDELIQRLCLLSKSVHILKYTIEKLTDKLISIYTNLTGNEKLYETTDTEICENMCYMFHVLELCLQRYKKAKLMQGGEKYVQSQESTQNSQEDEKEKMLKKSSIADIWRKKWIPNYKEDTTSDICMEKQCVLTKCGEVLNKIIVGCMEGYSLVSFAALQCFNLLQNQ